MPSYKLFGAVNGTRTRNIQLGKLTLCQLNYYRKLLGYNIIYSGKKQVFFLIFFVFFEK